MKRDYHPTEDNHECEKMLRGTYNGVLVMCNENVPYAVPINHAYKDGRFYFHCAPAGKKLDFLGKNPNVSYVIRVLGGSSEQLAGILRSDQLQPGVPPGCHGPYESVIACGLARIVQSPEETRAAFKTFMSFYSRPEYEPPAGVLRSTRMILLDVQTMTARREHMEKHRTEHFTWSKPPAEAS